jgi:hypothetical protein
MSWYGRHRDVTYSSFSEPRSSSVAVENAMRQRVDSDRDDPQGHG